MSVQPSQDKKTVCYEMVKAINFYYSMHIEWFERKKEKKIVSLLRLDGRISLRQSAGDASPRT